jgi:hypothetical protein
LLPAWNPQAPTVRQQAPAGGSVVQQIKTLCPIALSADEHGILPKSHLDNAYAMAYFYKKSRKSK